MMKSKYSLWFLAFATMWGVGSGERFANAQTGDESIVDENDLFSSSTTSFTLEVTQRGSNSVGTEPDNWYYFGYRDCVDNVALTFRVSVDDRIDQSLLSSHQLYIYVGSNCDDDIADCAKLTEGKAVIHGAGGTTFSGVSVRDLFQLDADACTDAVQSQSLWVALLETADVFDTEDVMEKMPENYRLSTSAPDTVLTIESVQVGSNKIQVSVAPVSDSQVAGVVAAYGEDSSDDCSLFGEQESLSAVADTADLAVRYVSDPSGITVSGVENQTSYGVVVASLDEFGNASAFSSPVCATPSASIGAGDVIATDGEYCFVATAVFGSYSHGAVVELRHFRDEFLKELPGGNAVVQGYYRVGPSLASYVMSRPQLHRRVRSGLEVFSVFSGILVDIGPWMVLCLLAGCVLLGTLLGNVVFAGRRNR